MAEKLCFKTADELSKLISSRQVSPVEVVQEHISRIQFLEPKLNSYITILADSALKQAKEHESEIIGGVYRGPLHGVPVALKDIFYVTGVPNTYGSKINKDFIPRFNSTVVNKFADAGAVLMGKLNLHQFAFVPLVRIIITVTCIIHGMLILIPVALVEDQGQQLLPGKLLLRWVVTLVVLLEYPLHFVA